MSARESIENLWDRATPVGPLLDQYAHELAEEIRQAWADHDPKKPGNVTMLSALNAADFIDPSAGPVRPDEEPT